jgi:hypothetical protein
MSPACIEAYEVYSRVMTIYEADNIAYILAKVNQDAPPGERLPGNLRRSYATQATETHSAAP